MIRYPRTRRSRSSGGRSWLTPPPGGSTPSPPHVDALSVSSGSTHGGTSVVITGRNFTGATSVAFGGTAASSFTVNSRTQITAVAPAHAAGTVDVRVTSPDGTSVIHSVDEFTFAVPAPAITAVSPSSGLTGGGTVVTITGTDFTGATAVAFGTTAASSFTVDSPTQITAHAPAHAAGLLDVRVTTPHGTSATTAADHYTYTDVVPVPTVTSVAPNSGALEGGDTVVLTGTNFTGATAVSFGATAATSFTVDSATQITATSPAHAAATVDITVTTAGGTSATGAGDQFTFGPVLVLSDNFNRADGPLGSPWAASGVSPMPHITSNQMRSSDSPAKATLTLPDTDLDISFDYALDSGDLSGWYMFLRDNNVLLILDPSPMSSGHAPTAQIGGPTGLGPVNLTNTNFTAGVMTTFRLVLTGSHATLYQAGVVVLDGDLGATSGTLMTLNVFPAMHVDNFVVYQD